VSIRCCPTGTTRFRGLQPCFVNPFNLNPAFGCLVLDLIEQRGEHPVKQPFVAVPAQLFILADVLGVVDRNRADVTGNTLLDNIFRDSVQEVVCRWAFFRCAHCSFAWAVFTFRVVFLLSEVMSILFECITRIQQRFITDRHGCRVADTKINTGCPLTR